MTRAEMIAIAHRGLLLGPQPMLRHHPGGRQIEVEGVVLRRWGSLGPALNKVAVIGSSPPLARILALAADFFGADSGGYGIVVEADAGHPVEAELRAAGWQVFEDEPALVLSPIPALPPLPVGVEVRPVRTDADRRDLVRVLAEGFGEPTSEGMTQLTLDQFESFTPSLACAHDPDVALLLGYVDGEPAATADLFVVGDSAGITGVATVPRFRRRGLGMALTWAAVSAGVAVGCTRATLAALGASFDLYRKMGFVHVCNHRAYQPPA